MNTLIRPLAIALSFSALFVLGVQSAAAAPACTFTQTLELGVISPEVQCLQEYLNQSGYQLTAVGPGSPGNETDKFGSLTQAAVRQWQEDNGVAPAIGIFGPVSQRMYQTLVGSEASAPTTASVPAEAQALLSMVADLEAELAARQAANTDVTEESDATPTPIVAGVSDSHPSEAQATAAQELAALVRLLIDTQEAVRDERGDMEDDELLEVVFDFHDALELFYDSVSAFTDADYEEASEQAIEAREEAGDVFEDVGGESPEHEAEDLIDDVKDLLEEIEELLEEADEQSADTGDAEEHLADAKRYLKDAEEAFENRIFRQAVSDALDAEEYLEWARDEIDVLTEDDAEDAINDAEDAIEAAEQEIEEAETDGESTDRAEDELDDAKRALRRAENALDDNDYQSAVEYANEAEDLADDAEDAIGEGDEEDELEERLEELREELDDAEEEVEEADDEGDDIGDAEDYLDEADEYLDDAEEAIEDEDWDEAGDLLDDAEDAIEDALDEL